MKVRKAELKDKKSIEDIFDLYWSDSFRHNLEDKLDTFLSNTEVAVAQKLLFIVVEDEGQVVGVAATRDCPEHMLEFTATENPAEFYVAAAKHTGRGIGTLLRDKRVRLMKDEGYTEIVFFSGETHKDSWGFHDNSSFERVGETQAPNGEKGYVWRLELK